MGAYYWQDKFYFDALDRDLAEADAEIARLEAGEDEGVGETPSVELPEDWLTMDDDIPF
jgi:hypothetical protein